ncbi:MAG: tetratricopeptide repeat protein [Planctomycetota bacterium]|nr:tetratricopeptide repeat protein [Planctomycetota bacterium]
MLAARAAVAGMVLSCASSASAQLVPKSIEPAPSIDRAERAAFLDDEERRQLRIRHGRWADGDLQSPDERLEAAIETWDFAFQIDATASALLRARALWQRGDTTAAFAALDAGEVADAGGAAQAAMRLRIQSLRALMQLDAGRVEDASTSARAALTALEEVSARDRSGQVEAAAAEAMAVLARTTPIDASALQETLDRLGAAAAANPLDWHGPLAEGRLLLSHHATGDGAKALQSALALNPRLAEAWYLLGRAAARQFDFDSAQRAIEQVESVSPASPLGSLLRAHVALVRGDADGAAEASREVLAMPGAATHREAMALLAAAQSLRLGDDAMQQALADYAVVAPGNAGALFDAGRFLSLQRQYARAAEVLANASAMEPNWTAPRLEMGALFMQSGEDERALEALRSGLESDPFDTRARLSLSLLEEISSWPVVEGEHFRIRCRPGQDELLAAEMLAPLEQMHREVCARLGHEPRTKTTIELMPDHEYFGVRLTGTPFIHTIAASTGPVIAMEPPREGPAKKFLGLFDWLEVLRHEYTHTVTLDQTSNRIPHWMTEAIAVDMELGARPDTTYRLLAEAWRRGEIFNLDDIKWAFIRPKRPSDRALAYAQGHWMVQFIRATWGDASIGRMLSMYAEGATEPQAMAQVLEVTPEEFLSQFQVWAGAQVRAWGFDPQPPLDQLVGEGESLTMSDELLAKLLQQHPDHADLAELVARRAVAAAGGTVTVECVPLLERYAALRPVDLWPRKKLAAHWMLRDPIKASAHLEALDSAAEDDPSFALELSHTARRRGDAPAALRWATRATRISPFDATLREEAAAAAIEAKDWDAARRQLEALTILEPDRAIHRTRMEKLSQLQSG